MQRASSDNDFKTWSDVVKININENDNILSIASAGENAISMLTKNPNRVYAIDLNLNQIACVELKKMAYKYLDYEECMKFIGVVEADNRLELYDKIKENF